MTRVESWLPYVNEDAIVVCHGGVLRVLEMILNATPPSQIMQVVMPQDRVYKWDGSSASWI